MQCLISNNQCSELRVSRLLHACDDWRALPLRRCNHCADGGLETGSHAVTLDDDATTRLRPTQRCELDWSSPVTARTARKKIRGPRLARGAATRLKPHQMRAVCKPAIGSARKILGASSQANSRADIDFRTTHFIAADRNGTQQKTRPPAEAGSRVVETTRVPSGARVKPARAPTVPWIIDGAADHKQNRAGKGHARMRDV
jgi:hypothetical protein